jgi:hypothetical protein
MLRWGLVGLHGHNEDKASAHQGAASDLQHQGDVRFRIIADLRLRNVSWVHLCIGKAGMARSVLMIFAFGNL